MVGLTPDRGARGCLATALTWPHYISVQVVSLVILKALRKCWAKHGERKDFVDLSRGGQKDFSRGVTAAKFR